MLPVKIKKLTSDAILPTYAHDGDAGMDLFSVEEVVLKSMEVKLVRTGIALSIPNGYEVQIRPKSGLALNHGITLLNTPGTIDSGYRGEIKNIMINLSNKDFKIEKGMKIAQMVFNEVERAILEEVEELDQTKRAGNGFGSTGLKNN